MFRFRVFWIWLVLLWPTAAGAAPLDDAYYAVVRIPSHGLSGVIISVSDTESLILSAAHGWEGHRRSLAVSLDLPGRKSSPSMSYQSGSLSVIDYQSDLALVKIPVRLPVAPVCVARAESLKDLLWAWSCGYDGMRPEAVWECTRVRSVRGDMLTTRGRPRPGRSGGGLFDARTGELVGIVQAYALLPWPEGIYASPGSINRFLAKHGQGKLIGQKIGDIKESPILYMPKIVD